MSNVTPRCKTCWHRKTTHTSTKRACSASACDCTKYINDEDRVPTKKKASSAKPAAE